MCIYIYLGREREGGGGGGGGGGMCKTHIFVTCEQIIQYIYKFLLYVICNGV